MPKPEHGFKVITADSWVKVEVFAPDGLPILDLRDDEPYLMVSSPDDRDGSPPCGVELIHMSLSEAREFHHKLGDMLSKFAGQE
jgi:hypothetical protein